MFVFAQVDLFLLSSTFNIITVTAYWEKVSPRIIICGVWSTDIHLILQITPYAEVDSTESLRLSMPLAASIVLGQYCK